MQKPSVPAVLRRQHSTLQPLVSQALALSAGTLATCTGRSTYAELDSIHADFVAWCAAHPMYATWQTAWPIFWAAHTPDTCPWPTVTPETNPPSVPAAVSRCARCGVGLSHGTERPKGSTEPLCLRCRQPSVPVTTLETLHASLEDAGAQEATKRQTERMSKELCGKKQSAKAQVAPGGMFAKEQLKLF